jgi:hypothetical protein
MIQRPLMRTAGVFLALLCPLMICSAQDIKSADKSRDFGGTWKRNNITLRISLRDSKLKISREEKLDQPLIILGKLMGSTLSSDFVYYTDGRGETNISTFGPAPYTSSEANSLTKWDGNNIVVSTSLTRKQARHKVTVKMLETWELSPDAKTLTQTTRIISAEGTDSFSEVFSRADR